MKSTLGLLIALIFIAFYIIVFMSPWKVFFDLDTVFYVMFLVCFILAIVIVVMIIQERIKVYREEKDDIDKYR
jgi:tetrahydromethanopterin S-methyltransferase subunit E